MPARGGSKPPTYSFFLISIYFSKFSYRSTIVQQLLNNRSTSSSSDRFPTASKCFSTAYPLIATAHRLLNRRHPIASPPIATAQREITTPPFGQPPPEGMIKHENAGILADAGKICCLGVVSTNYRPKFAVKVYSFTRPFPSYAKRPGHRRCHQTFPAFCSCF